MKGEQVLIETGACNPTPATASAVEVKISASTGSPRGKLISELDLITGIISHNSVGHSSPVIRHRRLMEIKWIIRVNMFSRLFSDPLGGAVTSANRRSQALLNSDQLNCHKNKRIHRWIGIRNLRRRELLKPLDRQHLRDVNRVFRRKKHFANVNLVCHSTGFLSFQRFFSFLLSRSEEAFDVSSENQFGVSHWRW